MHNFRLVRSSAEAPAMSGDLNHYNRVLGYVVGSLENGTLGYTGILLLIIQAPVLSAGQLHSRDASCGRPTRNTSSRCRCSPCPKTRVGRGLSLSPKIQDSCPREWGGSHVHVFRILEL